MHISSWVSCRYRVDEFVVEDVGALLVLFAVEVPVERLGGEREVLELLAGQDEAVHVLDEQLRLGESALPASPSPDRCSGPSGWS